jgi:alkanesulfonate monooxygenase SsuD/methylene tetrahydromethanopterin reductase-like flavin-dependent oxidoreductase (luciferase family)
MSTELWMRFDIRGGGLAVPTSTLAGAAIEQAAWAERHGFDAILLSEHHGTDDGYNPSPMILAAAIAARTQRVRLQLGALIAPLHDALRLAEDICVLDNVSNGRVDVTIGIGYVPSEFTMFGIDYQRRVAIAEESIATLRQAFTGEPFEFRGRPARITPAPVQKGGPRILLAGSVMATAKRAARLADGMFPVIASPELFACYREECVRLGRPVGRIVDMTGPVFVHVSEDPDRDWPRLAPHLLHEMNCYGKWASESPGMLSPFQPVTDAAALKASGAYLVLTPDACVKFLAAQRAADRYTMFNPLCGGLHPDVAWESLELFAAKVLPQLR